MTTKITEKETPTKMKRTTGRTIPIYPRLTFTNREWLAAKSIRLKRSEAEIIDTLLAHARKTLKQGDFKKLFKIAKAGN